MLYIGCHLSSSKGLCGHGTDGAVHRREHLSQFFTRNPRGGAARGRLTRWMRRRLCKCSMQESLAASSRTRPIR